jgi:uncharacterized membrane protein
LLHGLAALWPSYFAYAVTFLFIGQVWANHHVMFDHIRAADRVVLLLNTLLLMVVAFLPFATSVLAGAFRSGHGQRTAVVFYAIAFDLTALTFNAVWQYARSQRLLSEALDSAGATAIGRRFQLALAWLATGALLGALLPVLGVAVIAAFNAFLPAPDPRRESVPATLRRRCGLTSFGAGRAWRRAGVGRLRERDRVPVWIGHVHVAYAVRVGLDRFVLDAGSSEALEERVEPGDGEGDATCARACTVRLDEEPGVLVDLPEHLVPDATVWGSAEEARIPIDARVEIGYGNTGEKVGDAAQFGRWASVTCRRRPRGARR